LCSPDHLKILQESTVALPSDNTPLKGHPDALMIIPMIIPNSVIVPQQQQLLCPETPHVWNGMLMQKKQHRHNCLLLTVEIF
jgi:hypothetical protein